MRTLFTLSLLVFVLQSYAQLLNLGVKGGINVPDLKFDGHGQISDITTADGSGFHVGAMLRINLLVLYAQPEFIYTRTTTDFSFKSAGNDQQGTYVMQRLDVPIPVGVKLGPAAIFAGPVASINLDSPSDIFNASYKQATWGYQIGAGVKVFSFLAEIKYEGPFGDYAQGAQIAGQLIDVDTRQNMWIISVGYFF